MVESRERVGKSGSVNGLKVPTGVYSFLDWRGGWRELIDYSGFLRNVHCLNGKIKSACSRVPPPHLTCFQSRGQLARLDLFLPRRCNPFFQSPTLLSALLSCQSLASTFLLFLCCAMCSALSFYCRCLCSHFIGSEKNSLVSAAQLLGLFTVKIASHL